MFQFRLNSLLVAVAVVALWFSTFTFFAFMPAYFIRRSIFQLVVVAAVFTAFYGTGKRRAFWGGFATVMLLSGSHGVWSLEPTPTAIYRGSGGMNAYDLSIMATYAAIWTLSISVLGGFVASYIYGRSRKADDA